MTRPAKINLSAWPIITGTGGMGGISVPPGPPTPTGNFLTKNEGGQDTIKVHGNTGTTETFDPTDGNVHTATLDNDCTFTLGAPVGTGAATLELFLTQDGTGGRLVTWPGSVTWPGGIAPTLSTDAAAVDRIILETLDNGAVWYGVMVGGGSTTTTPSADNPHAHVVSEAHLSDGATTTYTLDEAFLTGSVIAWNTTTLARLGVTEAQPDQATVSAAGTTGDTIMFDYAAPVV